MGGVHLHSGGSSGGWLGYLRVTDEKPEVTWSLLKRVLGYSRPYRWHIAGMLILILVTTGTGLLMPLLLRDLIDHTIPAGDVNRLVGLALVLLLIPAVNGLVAVLQRLLERARRRRCGVRSAAGVVQT